MTADSSSNYPYLFNTDEEVGHITDSAEDSLTALEGRTSNGFIPCDSGKLSRVRTFTNESEQLLNLKKADDWMKGVFWSFNSITVFLGVQRRKSLTCEDHNYNQNL